MPDNAPDQPGGRPPGGGSRRSGLDRLRAARGGGEEPTVADQQSAAPAGAGASGADTTTSETVRSASVDASGESDAARGRSGVLLDKPREDVDTRTADTRAVNTDTADSESADSEAAGAEPPDIEPEGDTPAGGKGRRARKRAAAGTTAAATAPGSTADAKDGGTRPAEAGRFRRLRPTTPVTGPASKRQKIAAVLLGLVVIGLLVPVVVMRHRIVGETKEERAVDQLTTKRTVALSTARQFAVTFFSPDYKTIDDYNKQVLAGSTGAFNADFASKQADLKSLVTKAQSQATGRILAAGVSKVSGDDVEVLVVADQSVQNTLTKGKAQVLRTRVRITVHKTPDKGWLVSGFEPVT